MDASWQLLASNSVVAVVLAFCVTLLGWRWRRPEVLHLLWLLVLVKLVVPPFVTIGLAGWAAGPAVGSVVRENIRFDSVHHEESDALIVAEGPDRRASDERVIAQSSSAPVGTTTAVSAPARCVTPWCWVSRHAVPESTPRRFLIRLTFLWNGRSRCRCRPRPQTPRDL